MKLLKLCWGIAIISLFTSLYMINYLPDALQLPIHWNIDGEVDRYADASLAFLFPPAVMIFILSIISVLSKLDPRKKNIQLSHKSIAAFSLSITLLMVTIEASYIAMANGIKVPMMMVVGLTVGILLMITGNYLGKTRSNFFIGIRTPWTLSSDAVWQKTHRLAGKLFMIAGLVIVICCLLIPLSNLGILIILTVLPSVLIPCIYSWWLWKEQQNDDQSNNEEFK
ncbi:MAG: SdpI family protein [Colwellia sp.]|nr:SdpI family protein [Colwellia sp.]